jgi:transposase
VSLRASCPTKLGIAVPRNSSLLEGRVNHIKMIKGQMFEMAGLPLLRNRLLLTAQS